MKYLLILMLVISFANGYSKTSCSHWKAKANAAQSEPSKFRSGTTNAGVQNGIYFATMYNACEQENIRKAMDELLKIFKK